MLRPRHGGGRYTYMEIQLLYMDRRLLTYVATPSPGVISKKIDPRSLFAIPQPPWPLLRLIQSHGQLRGRHGMVECTARFLDEPTPTDVHES